MNSILARRAAKKSTFRGRNSVFDKNTLNSRQSKKAAGVSGS